MSRRTFCVVILLILAAALVEGCLIPLVLKLFADPVALGDSFVKTYLLLVYAFLATLVTTSKASGQSARSETLFLGGLLVLFAIGLGEFAFVQHRLGLSLGTETLFLSDGEMASTRLTHIHNSKVVLAVLFPRAAYQFDPGLPFLPLYPYWLVIGQAAFFAVTAVSLFAALFTAWPRLSQACFVLYALAGFMLLKGTLDGGLLSHETAVAWIVFLSLGPRGWSLPRLCVGITVAYLAFLGFWGLLDALFLGRLAWTSLYLWVLYRLLDQLGKRAWTQIGGWTLGLLLVTLGVPAAWSLTDDRVLGPGYETLVYGLSRIEPDTPIGLVSTHRLDLQELQVTKRIELGRYHLTCLEVKEPIRRLSLARRFRLNLNRRAISASPPDEHASFRARLKPLSGTPPKESPNSEWVYLGEGWYRVHLRLQSGANWNIAVSALSEQGVLRAVLLDHQLTQQVGTLSKAKFSE